MSGTDSAARVSGAEAVIRSLLAQGVDTIFGYPGGAIMPVYDALFDYRDRINHVLVRHEQGAGHAAEGYARLSGKAGVCLVTSGPGATNLVTCIADALVDSTPLVCIIGQVKTALLGTDAFQETDVIGITMPVSKWSYQITKADEIPAILAKAFYIAESGRPGPVVLDVTRDAQTELMTVPFQFERCFHLVNHHPRTKPKPDLVERAAALINSAKRPFLLIGHGILISKAEAETLEFVEKTGMPTAPTLLGLSAFPVDHPLYAGWLGMHGNYGPNLMTNECDVLVAIGMRFDDRVTGDLSGYARQAQVVHVDIDPAEIEKNVKCAVAINADAKETLKALLPLVRKNAHPEWLARFKACDEIEHDKVIRDELHPKDGKIKMGEAIRVLSEKSGGEAVIVADVGQHQMMAARYYRFKRPNSLVTSGGLGTMGFGLPAALGAKLAAPDREVVAVVGDGGFQMTIQELGTIAQSKLPVKIVILNNNFLGMVRQWQELFFDNRYSFVQMQNPDFVMVGKGFGIEGTKISAREELGPAIEAMLAAKTPYLLEIVVEKEQNVFPMIPSGAKVGDIRLS